MALAGRDFKVTKMTKSNHQINRTTVLTKLCHSVLQRLISWFWINLQHCLILHHCLYVRAQQGMLNVWQPATPVCPGDTSFSLRQAKVLLIVDTGSSISGINPMCLAVCISTSNYAVCYSLTAQYKKPTKHWPDSINTSRHCLWLISLLSQEASDASGKKGLMIINLFRNNQLGFCVDAGKSSLPVMSIRYIPTVHPCVETASDALPTASS